MPCPDWNLKRVVISNSLYEIINSAYERVHVLKKETLVFVDDITEKVVETLTQLGCPPERLKDYINKVREDY